MARPLAIVTGGSRGIGSAIVRRLAADGFSIVFTYAARADLADALIGAGALQVLKIDRNLGAGHVQAGCGAFRAPRPELGREHIGGRVVAARGRRRIDHERRILPHCPRKAS